MAEECKHESSSLKLLRTDGDHDSEASEAYVWLVCNDCCASSGRVKIFANSDEDRARVWEWARQQGTIPERHVSCMACGGAGVRHFCELPDDEQCSACNGRGYRNG